MNAWTLTGQVDHASELEGLHLTDDAGTELELEDLPPRLRVQVEAARSAAALLLQAAPLPGGAPFQVTADGHTVGPITVSVASKPMRTDPTG